MTGPVTTDDIVSGAVKYLATLSDVTAVLGQTSDGDPWLFQRKLWARVEGSGSTAAFLDTFGAWAAANQHNTARFPRLALEIWADPLRDAGGNVTEPGEVALRLNAAWKAFDARLHRSYSGQVYWGDVRVVASTRLADPTVYEVPGGDGLLRSLTYYAVTEA